MSFSTMPGTFRKSGGSGTATITVRLHQYRHGDQPQIGILSFSGGGSLTGTYGTAAGAITEFCGRELSRWVCRRPSAAWGFVSSPGPR